MRVLGLFLNCLVNSEKKPLFFLIKNQFYNSRGKKVSENDHIHGGGGIHVTMNKYFQVIWKAIAIYNI